MVRLSQPSTLSYVLENCGSYRCKAGGCSHPQRPRLVKQGDPEAKIVCPSSSPLQDIVRRYFMGTTKISAGPRGSVSSHQVEAGPVIGVASEGKTIITSVK